MASVLLGLVQVNDAAARLQGDGSAPARGYQRMGLDASAVDATLQAIEQHAGDRRAYQDMLLRHAARPASMRRRSGIPRCPMPAIRRRC
jgi:oligoendopeptidase F